MHGMAYLLALKTPKKCAYHGRVDRCEYEIPAKKKPCVFFFKRGCFTDRWGIGIYEMTGICLDGSKKKMQVSFFDLPSSLRCRSFTRWFTRCEREAAKKVGGRRDRFLWGNKSLAGGTCGSGNFTLSPRYKVCMIEREGFYFYFYFYFYLFLFFLFKRLR